MAAAPALAQLSQVALGLTSLRAVSSGVSDFLACFCQAQQVLSKALSVCARNKGDGISPFFPVGGREEGS